MNIEEIKKRFPGDWDEVHPGSALLETDLFYMTYQPVGTNIRAFGIGITYSYFEIASMKKTQDFYNLHFKFKNFK